MKIKALLVCAALHVGTVAGAQRVEADSSAPLPLRLDLPLLDAPYNIAHGLRAPSMAQSLATTEDFYELGHLGLQRVLGDRKSTYLFTALFDVLTLILPPGDAWVHEEFHRAVMGNRNIDSFNDVYKFDLESETIAVSHVKDDDLVRFKATHPAEQVRMGAAGIEGETLLVGKLEKNRFFYGSRANHLPLYWLVKLSSYMYLASSSTAEADRLTDEMNAQDGARVEVRDFTGFDFTGWVYDLHRPTEPYAARGMHPSGVGIDRYIKDSDLTPAEHAHLRREGRLQLLNFLDPNLLGIDGITVRSPWNGEPLRLNVTASHFLTSFGHTVDINLFLKQRAMNLFVTLHGYENEARTLPGIDAALLDYPVTVSGRTVSLSPRVALWLQPADQLFHASASRPGALLALRLRPHTTSTFGTFIELEGKTAGWVAGNVNLDANLSVRIGGSAALLH